MAIFKKKKQDKKMVGVLLSPHHFTYLNLYSLATDTAKNKVVGDLYSKWYTDKSKKIPIAKLVEEIRQKVERQWFAEKTKGVTFTEFSEKVIEYLKAKNISEEFIRHIININHEKNH